MKAILLKNTNHLHVVGETWTLFLVFCVSFVSSKKGFGFSLDFYFNMSESGKAKK